jgi:eukaryotic-like serine/threonine-protein kinase
MTTDRTGATRRLPGNGPGPSGAALGDRPTFRLPAEGAWPPARDSGPVEGSGPSARASEPVDGRLLGGRYRLVELLATGGMGEVWAAEDRVLGRPVAVKLLGGALAGDGQAAERLRREARAAARLGHPGIARVLDLGAQHGRPYLVMELLQGESLAARLARAGPLTPADAAAVVADVADALEAAHRAGVVHRDVKPGNVFLTDAGEVKVLDFGIASAAGEAALTTGGLLGTAAYLAPERVLGERATPAADVYALGVLLYELLAGRRPFEADSEFELAMAHVNARPVPLAEVAPSAPPSLVAACGTAMAKDPADRVPSAAAFADLLRTPASPAAGVRPASDPPTIPLPASGPRPTPTSPLPATGTRPPSVGPPQPVGPPPAAERSRTRPWRRGLVAALLLAGLALAALPALGGNLSGSGRTVELPGLVPDSGGSTAPAPVAPATTPDPPAGTDRRPRRQPAGDQRDRDPDDDRDDDSSGSGRSGGGDGGGDGGGGSSGPG